MWARVKSKKEACWILHAIVHDNGNVIGSREDDMLYQLTDILYNLNLNITSIYSDNNFAYHDIIPHNIPETSKKNTQRTERNHLTFRTRLKRLARKTIFFSKSHVMHNNMISLLINVLTF